MAQVIAQTRTMSGVRRTSGSDSVNCIVEAFHNISEGEVGRVDFVITVNGVIHSTRSVTSRGDWTPDDTDETDPLPGITSGPAPIAMAFGTTITMSDFSPGTIVVSPTAYPGTSGTSRVCDSITIYNDRDGTDRRPSNKVIYVSPNGNDSANGLTTGTPVKTMTQAIELCKTGSGLFGSDVGGGTIYLLEGTHIWGQLTFNAITAYTSGQHWITITRAPGLLKSQVIVRSGEVRFDGARSILAFNSPGANTYIRVRLKGFELMGRSLLTYGSLGKQFWLDGILAYSYEGREGLPHVKHISSGTGGAWIGYYDQEPVSVEPGVLITSGMRWATGCELRNTFGGWANFRMNRGYKSVDCVGIVNHIQASHTGSCNGYVVRINQWKTEGFFRDEPGPFTITRNGNTVRLTAQSTSKTWGEAVSRIVNSLQCGIVLHNGFGGETWAASDGTPTRSYFVTNGGYVNGLSFVEFDAPNFGTNITSQGLISVGTSDAYTAVNWLDTPPSQFATIGWQGFGRADPHSDLHQLLSPGSPVQNWMITHLGAEGSVQSQGFSQNTQQSNGFAFVNYYDGWNSPDGVTFMNNYLAGDWGQGILRHLTIGGAYQHIGVNAGAGSEIIDCVFQDSSLGNTGGVIRNSHNHFVNPSQAGGTNATSGVWWLKRNRETDASGTSASSGYGTASSLWNRGSSYFEGHRGALRNVALGNWALNTTPVNLGQIRSLNKTGNERYNVLTCGVPFPKGTVFSKADKLIVSEPSLGALLAQWYPIGGKYDDGSYKYGRVSYLTYMAAGSLVDSSVSVRGSYTPTYLQPGVSNIQRDSTFVRLRINNQTQLTNPVTGITFTSIPLSDATVIEGGGPEDRYTRYRWFGRFTNIPNIWVEFTYDIPTTLDHIRFWIRFGNSNIIRGYGNSLGPYAATFGYSLTSPIELDIITPTGGTSTIINEATDTISVTSIANGRRYTLVDSSTSYQSGFRAGMCKSTKGLISYSNSSTAIAELNSATVTMFLGWEGNNPPWFSSNPKPSYITDEASGWSLIENGHLPSQQRPFGEPYSAGVFSLQPKTSGTGSQGWAGTTFWSNPLYHVIKSRWPAEFINADHSIRTLCYRNAWWVENTGNYLTRKNYPNIYFYYTSLHGIGATAYDFLGYGTASYPSGMQVNEYRSGAGQPYEGPDMQHSQLNSDFLYALLSGDYYALKAAEVWAEIWAINLAIDTTNQFVNEIEAARAIGRSLMTAIILYEITNNLNLRNAIIARFSLVYDLMNGTNLSSYVHSPPYGDAAHAGFICPVRSIDRVRFVKLEIGNQAGNLVMSDVFNRKHTYPWQEAMVAAACYQIYLVFSRENPVDVYALRARELAYDLAASNVLITQKFGPGTDNAWEWMGITVPDLTLSTRQQWNLGTSVVGLTSGATGTIFYQSDDEAAAGGQGRLAIYLKNVGGIFQLGETLQNNSSGATCTLSYLFRGYPGITAYRIDHTIGQPWSNMTTALYNQRQTPWTRAQLEEYDTNATGYGQLLGASPNIIYYPPYMIWQIHCAVIVQEGCQNGFYTDATDMTVSQLLTKARDIISYGYNLENNSPQTLNNQYQVWPVGFWPGLTVRSNFYQLSSGDLSCSVNIGKISSSLSNTFNPLDVTATQAISATINSNPVSSTLDVNQSNVTIVNAGINVSINYLRKLSSTIYTQGDEIDKVGILSVISTIVIDNSINMQTVDSTAEQVDIEQIITEQNPDPSVIVHITLNMLLDGPMVDVEIIDSENPIVIGNGTDNGINLP